MELHLPIPDLPGYRPVVVHDCPRCRRPVRVAYRLTDRAAAPDPETAYTVERSIPGFRITFHDLGAVAIETVHAEPQDAWWATRRLFEEGGCGWVVPEIDQHTISLVDRLIVGGDAHLEVRVEGTPDTTRFVRSPLVRWASAREDGYRPLGLVALPLVARAILADGADPDRLPPAADLMGANHDQARALLAAQRYAALFGVALVPTSAVAA